MKRIMLGIWSMVIVSAMLLGGCQQSSQVQEPAAEEAGVTELPVTSVKAATFGS